MCSSGLKTMNFQNMTNDNKEQKLSDSIEAEIDGHGGGVLYGYCHGSAVIRTLYLHDLQNKFFAITGKDLEINLA